MKPVITLVSLTRRGRSAYLVVRGQFSHLFHPTSYRYDGDDAVATYCRNIFADHKGMPTLDEYCVLFTWVRNRLGYAMPIEDITSMLGMESDNHFGQLCQEQPLETLQMFAELNELPLTAETVFDFE